MYTTFDRKRDAAELAALERAAIKSELAPRDEGIQPVDTTAAAGNELRPSTWREVVGQRTAKDLLARMVDNAKLRGVPLDHVLLVGPSGTGKTTLAHVIATELQSQVWQFEAPISADTLTQLAEKAKDGDIIFLDEIHQQAVGDRRGRQSSTQPEVLFSVMEDFTLPTGTGVIPFPRVTIMGATTDEGALPDAFVNRFPIRPRLESYTVPQMARIADTAARRLGLKLTPKAAHTFAAASRAVPREVINYVRNAAMLSSHEVDSTLAVEVVTKLNGCTLDGLTRDQQAMLTFMYTLCGRETKGVFQWSASVTSIATAIGKSRDVKAVQLRVEPYLISAGYVQVAPGLGRLLTPKGVERAVQLQEER
jgi:Holliday junction DNA helicase RuvB